MNPSSRPRSLATISDGTAQSRLDDEEDPVDALECIFTPDTFDKFMRVEGQPHQSVITEAFRFVLERTRNHDLDAPSETDLLHHFGIQSGGLVHRLRNLVGCMFRRPFGPASRVNHLQNIESLARVFCEENVDGGMGYSFGALLDRYLFFHLIYFQQHQVGVEACLIGGEGRRFIEGGNHETDQDHRVRRPDEAPDAKVTLRWVRGGYLVRAGVGHVYERVKKGLPELLGHELDPNLLYLCHGTTIAHASGIVREGPSLVGAVCTDFGQAFYLTNSFEFAVFSGYMVSGGRSDTAVLVFPVPRDALDADRTLELTGDAWQQVVCKCRTGKRIKNASLQKAYERADCVIGPISFNAQQVDTGRHEARSLDFFQQWAFKGETFARSFFGDIINSGAVHVFRVVHEQEEEWRVAGAPLRPKGFISALRSL